MNLFCDDCGRLIETPLYEPNGGEISGMPTYDTVSECCRANIKEEKVIETFTLSEEEYYMLIVLAQEALSKQGDELQFVAKSLRPIAKCELIAKAKLAGLDATDWYKEFISDLDTL